MDEALTSRCRPATQALRQIVADRTRPGRQRGEAGLAGLKKIEEDFIDDREQVASSANERVRPELRALVRARHACRHRDRASRRANLMAEFTFTGIELAGQFGARFAQMASGVLAGMADALEKIRSTRSRP